jgi:hypothetical protein
MWLNKGQSVTKVRKTVTKNNEKSVTILYQKMTMANIIL